MRTTHTIAHSLLALGVTLVALLLYIISVPMSAYAATGSVSGYIFRDHSGPGTMYNGPTDTDGIWQQYLPEYPYQGLMVTVYDTAGPHFGTSDWDGLYTVSGLQEGAVLVVLKYPDINIPSWYMPSTTTYYLVDVVAGQTTTIPYFGVGPNPNM